MLLFFRFPHTKTTGAEGPRKGNIGALVARSGFFGGYCRRDHKGILLEILPTYIKPLTLNYKGTIREYY